MPDAPIPAPDRPAAGCRRRLLGAASLRSTALAVAVPVLRSAGREHGPNLRAEHRVRSVGNAPAVGPLPRLVTGAGAELPIGQLLGMLVTAPEHRIGYQRSLFRHWIDADGIGCDTRREV